MLFRSGKQRTQMNAGCLGHALANFDGRLLQVAKRSTAPGATHISTNSLERGVWRCVGVPYLPGRSGAVFVSRQALGLAYCSQRALPSEHRAIERSVTAQEKLRVVDQSMLDMPYCPRAEWMRHRTHRDWWV